MVRRSMAGELDTVLEIDTPEHLAFQVRLAGPARRALAWAVDFLVRSLLLMTIYMFTLMLFGSIDAIGVGTGLILLASFVIGWFYFVAFELLTGGRSPGKIAFKLRVVRTNGLPVTWRESLLRNLVRAIDLDLTLMLGMKIPPIGIIAMALDPKFRRLGDMVAGTIVVFEDKQVETKKKVLKPNPDIVGDLPAVLPLDRLDLEALELFVHRSRISPARRKELAEIVADDFAARVARPRPRDPVAFLASLWARAQDPQRRTAR